MRSVVRGRPAPSEGTGTAASGPGEGTRSLFAAAVYAAGFVVQRAIGLLLLPLYTRAVTPEEYGTLGLLLGASTLVAVFFSFGLDAAVTRQYFQLAHDPERREQFIQSLWKFLFVFPLVSSLLLAASSWPFVSATDRFTPLEVSLMLVSSALTVSATTVPFALLRARRDLRGYLYLTGTLAFLTPLLTWFFVVELNRGVEGWFLAATGASGVAVVVAAMVLPWRRHVPFSAKAVKIAVVFSLPLFPHFISHWTLQVIDRFVITGMVSRVDLGIYVLASTLAVAVLAILQAVNSGFTPEYARAGAEPGREHELANLVVLQITAVIGITLAGALLGPSAVVILTEASYHGAADIVPWLVLGYGFVGFYYIPMNAAVLGTGRRRFTFVATLTSAAVNVGLLFQLVPEYGIHGAAVASAAAYLLLLVLIAAWAHSKPTPVYYRWVPIAKALCVGVGIYAAASLVVPSSDIAALVVRLGAVTLFAVYLGVGQFRSQISRLLELRRA